MVNDKLGFIGHLIALITAPVYLLLNVRSYMCRKYPGKLAVAFVEYGWLLLHKAGDKRNGILFPSGLKPVLAPEVE
jgi:hypothetical protein